MSEEVQQLRGQNELLRSHVKRLLRVEQSLYLSQQSLKRQVQRLDALNRFATDAARLSEPAAVLRRGALAFLEVFSADQAVGYVVSGGVLTPSLALGAGGVEPPGAPLREVLVAPSREAVPSLPEVCSEERFLTLFPGSVQLLHDAAVVFGGPPAPARGLDIFLPIFGSGGELSAVLLFRMLGEQSFHEEKPGPEDLSFLRLLGQQIAAAGENASLVASLSVSYQRLAEAQQELVKRERLSALGELSAVVAHEVRNPLAAMVNVIATMKRRQGPEEEQGSLLGILSEEVERLDRMVNDMLDFARPNAPVLRQESVAQLVRDAAHWALAATTASAPTLVFQGDDGPMLGWIDARMVRQAVVNLVLNAAQSSPAGGAITVSLVEDRRGEDEVARIEVADQGSGIAESHLERIFQPFFTTRATGTGLGLALVKRFAEAHAGEVYVASTLGRGTTFTLVLPLGRSAVQEGRVSGG